MDPAAVSVGPTIATPLPIGAIVGRTLDVFGRALPAMGALAAGVILPLWALDHALAAAGVDAAPGTIVVGAGLWAALVLLQLATATALALQRLRGARASLGAALATAGARFVPAAVVVALAAAAILAGLSVLVVPGLVALASLAIVLPAAVDARGGPWRPLVRSLDLTRGQRGRVLAALAIVGALTAVALVVLWLGCAAMGVLVGEDAAGVAAAWATVFVLPLPAIGSAAAYEALRAATEAPRGAELERVFE